MTAGAASAAAWPVLVLAGRRRGAVDPMATAAGVADKALVPVAGGPMLGRVLTTLLACPGLGAIAVAVADPALLAAPGMPADQRIRAVDCDASPSLTVLTAGAAIGRPVPLLITTGDHPLLSAEMVAYFRTAATTTGADLAVAVAAAAPAAEPGGGRRTRYRFRDGRFCGCNLYAVLTQRGWAAFSFWAGLERDRKRPWRIARALGYGSLIAYMSGQLTLEGAFARAGRAARLKAAPVRMPWAEAAVDVDTPADRALAERLLAARAEAPDSAAAARER